MKAARSANGPSPAANLYALELPQTGWCKSKYSVDGDCVEILRLPGGGIAIRDSKNPALPALRITDTEWKAFRSALITGDL